MLIGLLLLGCGEKRSGKKIVFVGIPPYAYAVQELTQGAVEVQTLIKKGQNAHSFTPTPKQIQKLSQADIYFSSGLEFEKSLIPRIKKLNKKIRIEKIYEGINHRSIEDEGHEGHGAHCSGHNHEGDDPHLWLSPELYMEQVGLIGAALVDLDSSLSRQVEEQMKEMAKVKERVDVILKELFAPFAGSDIYVYHPAFGYFTDHYNLRQNAIETGGKSPSAKALQRFINEIKAQSVNVIFVQKQYSKRSAEIVAKEAGCRVVSIDPMPVDYFKDLEELGRTIARELGE